LQQDAGQRGTFDNRATRTVPRNQRQAITPNVAPGSRDGRRDPVPQRSYFRGSDFDSRGSDEFRRRVDPSQRGRELQRGRLDNDQFDRNRFDRDRNRRSSLDDRFDRDRMDRRDAEEVRRQLDRRQVDWRRNGDRIRSDWRRRNRDDIPFRFGWWDNYAGARWPVYSPWRYNWWRDRPYFWWGWTPAPRLTDWLVFNWTRPYYWAYGPGGNIYYRDNYVYYDNQQYLPVDDYYQQVYDVAHRVPPIDPGEAERMDWMPLGVFAAMREGEQADHRVIQLAVNKDGVISGTYFNPQTKKVHPLSGMVDERTQRAAWAFADGEHSAVVFETSLYNLTESESTMMVHFSPQSADAEVWQLVRLEQPEADPAALQQPAARLP
jgi:hypothetical protein